MSLPPGAKLVSGTVPVMKLPPGATLVSGPTTPQSTQAIDFSSIGGRQVSGPPIDFSSIGGKLVSAPRDQAVPTSTPADSTITGISAVPPATSLRDKISNWATNVANDVKYGTDTTGIGSVLKKMGAHGVYNGNSEAVGDFMASLPLGLLRTSKGAAEITEPGEHWQGAKDVVAGGLQAAQLPASLASPEVADTAEGAVEAGANAASKAGSAVRHLIPSTEHAGQLFEDVKGAAGNFPIDIHPSGSIALDTQKLSESGGVMPKVMSDFLNRVTDPGKTPLTYSEARDFYSNASRLSADEMGRLTPVMRRQVATFTKALGSSIQEAAEVAGKAEDYQNAMAEYRNAMRLRNFGQNVKGLVVDQGLKWGTAAAGVTGAAYAARKVLGQ